MNELVWGFALGVWFCWAVAAVDGWRKRRSAPAKADKVLVPMPADYRRQLVRDGVNIRWLRMAGVWTVAVDDLVSVANGAAIECEQRGNRSAASAYRSVAQTFGSAALSFDLDDEDQP